jgi:hypothetical protein
MAAIPVLGTLLVIWALGWCMSRRSSALAIALAAVPYALFVAVSTLWGLGGQLIDTKTFGIRRALGRTVTTGFTTAGSPSLVGKLAGAHRGALAPCAAADHLDRSTGTRGQIDRFGGGVHAAVVDHDQADSHGPLGLGHVRQDRRDGGPDPALLVQGRHHEVERGGQRSGDVVSPPVELANRCFHGANHLQLVGHPDG